MRRTSKLLTASALTTAAALVAGVLGTAAHAATTSTATLTGGTGTHSSDGVLYAKQGALLTLLLTTTAAKCVIATNGDGTEFARSRVQGNNNAPAQTSWTLGGTALGGSGSKSVSVVAYDGQNCTQGGGTAVTRSYTAANSAPTLTGEAAPATGTPAAQNGWYRGDVVVTWSCASVPAALGLRADGGCATASPVTGEGANLSAAKTVTDNVGNSKSTTVNGIKIDTTKPTTSLLSQPSGFYRDSVTLTLVPGSDLSGVATTHYAIDNGPAQTGTEVTVTGEGSHVVRYWSVDVAGNIEDAQPATVNIDLTDPTITSSQDPDKNTAQWNNGPVTVSFRCLDEGGSGIASCAGDGVVSTEGEGQEVIGTATDGAGRTTQTTHVVNIDLTSPTISGSPDRAAENGWYRDNVVVTFGCYDPGATSSGVASCPAAHTFSGEGANQFVDRTVQDRAGNSGSTSVMGISLDRTAPVTTSNAPTGWQADSVTVTLTPGTDLSGVAGTLYSVNGGTFVAGNLVTISDEGSTTLRYYSVDVAGNQEVLKEETVRIDRTPPLIENTGPTASATGNDGWYNTAVVNGFLASDTGSSLAAGQPADFTQSSGTNQGSAVTISSGPVADALGHTNPGIDSEPFKIDLTAPTLSGVATTEPNGHGWYRADVAIVWTAADQAGLSGIDTATQPANSVIDGEGGDLRAGPVTVRDVAANTSAPASLTGIRIDRTAPGAPTFSGIAAQGYTTETVPASSAISCTATDALSTLDTCTVRNYGNTVGSHTLTATATDKAGNTSTSTLIYNVTPAREFTLKGFYQPIGEANSIRTRKGDAVPTASSSTVWNTAKGGSTIPLKFNVAINGVEQTSTGTDVIKSFTATRTTCPSAAAVTDAVEELASAGSTTLRYENGQYIQNWKTSTVSVNTCFRVALITADDSAIYTFVQLRK